MTQARAIDGAAGYRFFLAHDATVTLDEINEHLRGLKLRELKPRSLTHFRKLRRHGYESYLTQNRLDLAVAGEFAWSDDMRAQYSEVAESTPARLLTADGWVDVTVASLGLASASVIGSPLPGAGRAVVLQLVSSRIERAATVARHDPIAGRADLVFDTQSSLPVAAADAPERLELTFAMPPEAESIVALTDLLMRVERLVTRVQRDDEPLPRVAGIRKASPLVLELLGGESLKTIGGLIATVVAARYAWFQGTKAKYEGHSVRDDNEQRRRQMQHEADAELVAAIEAEENERESPTLDNFAVDGLSKGEPGSLDRRQFIESVRAAIALPIQLLATNRSTSTERRER